MGAKQSTPPRQRMVKPRISPPDPKPKVAPHLLGAFGSCNVTRNGVTTSGNIVPCSNSKGRAFSFSACVNAYVGLVYGVDNTNGRGARSTFPFYFNSNMYFTIENAFVASHYNNSWMYSTWQKAATQGALLTEFHANANNSFSSPTALVTRDNTTNPPAQYAFYQNNDDILVQVSRTGKADDIMFLMFQKVGDVYVSVVTSLAFVQSSGVRFGVVASGSTINGSRTGMVLLYTDNTVTKPVVVSLLGGNDSDILSATAPASIPYLNPQPGALLPPDATTAGGVLYTYYGFYAATSASNGTAIFDTSALSYCDMTMQLAVDVSNNITKNNAFNLALWQLDLAPDSALQPTATFMGDFMDAFCTGVTTTPDGSKVTYFNASYSQGNPTGYLCNLSRRFYDPVGDAFVQKLCGVDPISKKPYTRGDPAFPSDDILATVDCSCVNYVNSTYQQKVLLNKDYQDFTTYLANNNINFQPGGDYRCWWPSCINNTGALILSTADADKGYCPNNTICINAITNQSASGDSNVINNIVNNCGNTYNGTPTPAPPQVPTAPDTSIASKPWFWPAVIVTGIVILLLLFMFVVRSTSQNAKSAGGTIVYVSSKRRE